MIGYEKLAIILNIADTCIRCKSDEESLKKIFAALKILLPFESAIIAIDSDPNFRLKSENQVFTSQVSPDWISLYFKKELYKFDPVLYESVRSNLPVAWKNINWQLTKETHNFKLLAEKYFGINGITLIFKDKVASTLISLRFSDSYTLNDEGCLISWIAPHIHAVFEREGSYQRKRLWTPDLSKREIEVLQWLKDGKSNWDISVILSISERTVKFHLSNIFKKLVVNNRSQALAKGMNYGLIDLEAS